MEVVKFTAEDDILLKLNTYIYIYVYFFVQLGLRNFLKSFDEIVHQDFVQQIGLLHTTAVVPKQTPHPQRHGRSGADMADHCR